jgi:hypothetical protein
MRGKIILNPMRAARASHLHNTLRRTRSTLRPLPARTTMKTNTIPRPQTNTYALLVHSTDVKQSTSETFVYLLLILIAAFSTWLAVHQPFRLPLGVITESTLVHSSPAQSHPR